MEKQTKETTGYFYSEDLKRIADALDTIIKMVKEDQERSKKYMEEKKDEQKTRLGEYPGPSQSLALAAGSRPKLQAPSGKLQAPSSKLDKTTLQRYNIL